MDHSIKYLHQIITDFLTNKQFFPGFFDTIDLNNNNLVIILQIHDRAIDIDTLAYCGIGDRTTLIPDVHFWSQEGYFQQRMEIAKNWISWENRVPKVFWRGSTTGNTQPLTLASLYQLPRFRLCSVVASSPRLRSVVDTKLTRVVQVSGPEEGKKIKDALISRKLFSDHIPQIDFLEYRYHLDIDGNSSSWGLFIKLLMGACVLKIDSPWRQWYYGQIVPWEHFIPIKSDLSDLECQVEWCLANDERSRMIAENGRRLATEMAFASEMLRAANAVLRSSVNSHTIPGFE